MAEKIINGRIVQKHDVASNWLKATNFIPKQGEIIIYDIDANYDHERIKIGDGVKNVNDLPFVDDTLRISLEAEIGAVSDLVGDKAVSEQINIAAVNNQSDLSVNDEASPAYVKNRTHWSKISQTEILPERQLKITENGYFVIEDKIEAVVGRTYIINWNSTSYTCVASVFNDMLCIGNGKQVGEDDTGEPFLMGFYPIDIALQAGFYAIIIPLDGSAACTISIIEQIEHVHKVDNKYLSDEVLAKPDWNVSENEFGYISNRTHYTEEALEETILETTVTFDNATIFGRDTGTATGSATQIYPAYGEMFAIEWNGVKYYSEVREYTKTDGSSGRGIGNSGMFGGMMHSEYPFLIGFLTEEEAVTAGHTYSVWVNDGSTTATFSVFKVGELVHRLDEKYLPENVATKPKITTITLPAASWTGDANPWSQVVTVNGVTANSKIDLQPTAIQIVELQDSEITLMLQNDDGVVTAWAIGNKPTKDYTIQVLITEVVRV